ncbi:chemotaxis response regulator protein-glutamate methylesterase [Aquabacterium sp. A08]|uniref:protein-glutamate methylesterase/protein-glutamine glutaminase n=1 Tax=Aquabacterium sp. A08 TaxID=2718532 RepID=UPI00141E7000|nr:chemotaxis response regulator protein-glutamate methylesterase [Aquabacterium sp. A08]NIC41947.1 chemotaxis response regulator protein-glutamate methylesterase [Aquabacterium sp. A08]NIC41990.1 chemotaxis response regulator protein-glutamate methylesterase [Aquabacterium sp. A08]
MQKITVVVVDDSALVRSLLTEIINQQPDMACIGAANDPLQAREMIRELNPDVITLDVEMPKMDGLEFLSRLMRLRPMPVVMVSTLTEQGADTTLRALEMGAVDFVAKPRVGVSAGLRELGQEIVEKIRIASQARVSRHVAPPAPPTPPRADGGAAAPPRPATRLLSTEKMICIGASTGGTEAIKEILVELPADAPAIVITQHMPAGFTSSFAARLDSLCKIRVAEAQHGQRLLPGHAYIAPGGTQFHIERSGANYVAVVDDGPPVNRHKPSVEVLFKSCARVLGPNAVGVMLTGMGGDGAAAMREMRDAGSYNIVQDEASCVVFGMPKMAIQHGAAHEVLPLRQIARAIMERVNSAGGVRHRI